MTAAIVLSPASCHPDRQAAVRHPNDPKVSMCAICAAVFYQGKGVGR